MKLPHALLYNKSFVLVQMGAYCIEILYSYLTYKVEKSHQTITIMYNEFDIIVL